MSQKKVALPTLLRRGWRMLCPQCGESEVFEQRFVLRETCAVCGWEIRKREEDTYFFMYMSAGVITGAFLISFFFVRPKNILIGRLVVGAMALLAYYVTHRRRKGLALAFEYFTDHLIR